MLLTEWHDKARSRDAYASKKLGLSWAKLKFSLVRVVDEVTVIFNSVEVEIEVAVDLSLLFLVGGGGEKNEINAILNSVVV